MDKNTHKLDLSSIRINGFSIEDALELESWMQHKHTSAIPADIISAIAEMEGNAVKTSLENVNSHDCSPSGPHSRISVTMAELDKLLKRRLTETGIPETPPAKISENTHDPLKYAIQKSHSHTARFMERKLQGPNCYDVG